MKNNSFLAIAKLKNLEHLNLSDVANIDNDIIVNIANNCKKLKHLTICPFHLNDSDLSKPDEISLKILDKLENLEELIMNNSFIAKNKMPTKMYNLKIIKCDNCENISDNDIIEILHNSPNLYYLSARNTGITLETIVYAIEKIKSRTNDIHLHIEADAHLQKSYERWKNLNPNSTEQEKEFTEMQDTVKHESNKKALLGVVFFFVGLILFCLKMKTKWDKASNNHH